MGVLLYVKSSTNIRQKKFFKQFVQLALTLFHHTGHSKTGNQDIRSQTT